MNKSFYINVRFMVLANFGLVSVSSLFSMNDGNGKKPTIFTFSLKDIAKSQENGTQKQEKRLQRELKELKASRQVRIGQQLFGDNSDSSDEDEKMDYEVLVMGAVPVGDLGGLRIVIPSGEQLEQAEQVVPCIKKCLLNQEKS